MSYGKNFTNWLPDVVLPWAEAQLVCPTVNQMWEASTIWHIHLAEPAKRSELTCEVIMITDAHERRPGTCGGVSCLLPSGPLSCSGHRAAMEGLPGPPPFASDWGWHSSAPEELRTERFSSY